MEDGSQITERHLPSGSIRQCSIKNTGPSIHFNEAFLHFWCSTLCHSGCTKCTQPAAAEKGEIKPAQLLAAPARPHHAEANVVNRNTGKHKTWSAVAGAIMLLLQTSYTLTAPGHFEHHQKWSDCSVPPRLKVLYFVKFTLPMFPSNNMRL